MEGTPWTGRGAAREARWQPAGVRGAAGELSPAGEPRPARGVTLTTPQLLAALVRFGLPGLQISTPQDGQMVLLL